MDMVIRHIFKDMDKKEIKYFQIFKLILLISKK